jgi:hypothetical protein
LALAFEDQGYCRSKNKDRYTENTSKTKCTGNKTKSIDASSTYKLVHNKTDTDREKVKASNLGIVETTYLVSSARKNNSASEITDSLSFQ